MSYDRAEQSVAYTREFVHHFWNGDIARMRAMLADGFTWTGVQQGQFCLDAETFGAAVAAAHEAAPRAILMEEAYEPLFHNGGVYTVAGRYLAHTGTGPRAASAVHQRTTMVWRTVDGDLKLAHWHLSCPLAPEDGGAPAAHGPDACRRAAPMASQRFWRTASTLRDVCGTAHLLRLLDVVYLEARKQSTVVHCADQSFRVRGGIQALAATLMGPQGRGLVRAHRSFYVNALYVEEIAADGLVLAGGARIPVAARRRTALCEEIERARREE